MVDFAFIIGIFSYIIFGLGILGQLSKGVLNFLSLFFLFILVIFFQKKVFSWFKIFYSEIKKDVFCYFLLGLFLLQVLVNFIGVLGPELGFDALWYHLTLPKIYLHESRIFYLPGSLFYYSAMPKLTEMFYLLSLNISRFGILAKFIHFSFGILSAVVLFNLSRKYLNSKLSLLTVLIFYSSLVVGWESITAYVDLTRTFFEILALEQFLLWNEKRKNENLINSAISLGLAISTKLIALATLPVFLILILWKKKKLSSCFLYLVFSIFVPLPWFVFSYLYTKNPVYPILSGILDQSHKIVQLDLFRFFHDIFALLFRSPDPISPVYLIFLPLIIWEVARGKSKKFGILSLYVFLCFVFWYFTPRTGGARFILPYLPAFSLLTTGILSKYSKFWQKLLVLTVVFSSLISIGYRALANKKFLPVLLAKETRNEFLQNNLNFSFGDIFDMQNEIKKKLSKDDLVLVYGSHNLFYLDFPFVHYSYAKYGLPASFVLIQGNEKPKDVKLGNLVYENLKTNVKLYLFKEWQK